MSSSSGRTPEIRREAGLSKGGFYFGDSAMEGDPSDDWHFGTTQDRTDSVKEEQEDDYYLNQESEIQGPLTNASPERSHHLIPSPFANPPPADIQHRLSQNSPAVHASTMTSQSHQYLLQQSPTSQIRYSVSMSETFSVSPSSASQPHGYLEATRSSQPPPSSQSHRRTKEESPNMTPLSYHNSSVFSAKGIPQLFYEGVPPPHSAYGVPPMLASTSPSKLLVDVPTNHTPLPHSQSMSAISPSLYTSQWSTDASPYSISRHPLPTSDPDKKKKSKLTPQDRYDICIKAKNGPHLRQEDIAKQYGVDRSTIAKILINSAKWLGPDEAIVPKRTPRSKSLIEVKPFVGRYPLVEDLLNDWLDGEYEKGGQVDDKSCQEQAITYARSLEILEGSFKASPRWLDKFKQRRAQLGKSLAVFENVPEVKMHPMASPTVKLEARISTSSSSPSLYNDGASMDFAPPMTSTSSTSSFASGPSSMTSSAVSPAPRLFSPLNNNRSAPNLLDHAQWNNNNSRITEAASLDEAHANAPKTIGRPRARSSPQDFLPTLSSSSSSNNSISSMPHRNHRTSALLPPPNLQRNHSYEAPGTRPPATSRTKLTRSNTYASSSGDSSPRISSPPMGARRSRFGSGLNFTPLLSSQDGGFSPSFSPYQSSPSNSDYNSPFLGASSPSMVNSPGGGLFTTSLQEMSINSPVAHTSADLQQPMTPVTPLEYGTSSFASHNDHQQSSYHQHQHDHTPSYGPTGDNRGSITSTPQTHNDQPYLGYDHPRHHQHEDVRIYYEPPPASYDSHHYLDSQHHSGQPYHLHSSHQSQLLYNLRPEAPSQENDSFKTIGRNTPSYGWA